MDEPQESLASRFTRLTELPEHDESAWGIVFQLAQTRIPEVFEYAVGLLASENPAERSRALDVVGWLASPLRRNTFGDASLRLAAASVADSDPRVVRSAANALRELHTAQARAILATLAAHADPDVRICVAAGLGYTIEHLNTLITLSRDPDDNVRDWATHGIAGIEVNAPVDSPEIRAALRDRLEDPFEDAAKEALWGLALRRDPDALHRLRQALANDPWPGDIHTAQDILGMSEKDEQRLIAELDEMMAAADRTSAP